MSTKTFRFNTGVQRSTGHSGWAQTSKPIPLMPGQQWSTNDVKVIPFECEDVPDGAALMFLCDYTDLPESQRDDVIVRALVPGSSMISKYAYFRV